MVDRLVQCKETICAELAVSDAFDNLTGNEWKWDSRYQTVLEPFEQATNDLCGEKYATLIMKIPAISILLKHQSKFIAEPNSRGSGIILARFLVESLQTRFHEYKTTFLGCVDTLLDTNACYLSQKKKALQLLI